MELFLHGATSVEALLRSITNLPFLSLGELRKNGIWAEATLLPLRDAGKTGRKERGIQENQDAECEKT